MLSPEIESTMHVQSTSLLQVLHPLHTQGACLYLLNQEVAAQRNQTDLPELSTRMAGRDLLLMLLQFL